MSALSVDDLIERYPDLLRPLYAKALIFASQPAPAPRACALALFRSLIVEEAPFLDDLVLLVAQLAFWLHMPEVGIHAIEANAGSSQFHVDAQQRALEVLRSQDAVDIAHWCPGPAAVARAVRADFQERLWLAVGPTTALATLLTTSPAYVSVAYSTAAAAKKRFGRIPENVALLESQVEPWTARSFAQQYLTSGASQVLACSAAGFSDDELMIEGANFKRVTVSVPAAPLHLDAAPYWQGTGVEDSGTTQEISMLRWTHL